MNEIITIQQASENHQKRIQQRETHRKNFAEESHELSNVDDLCYWADVTGYTEEYIIENARDLNQVYLQAFNAGLSFDEMIGLQPVYEEDHEEEYLLELF
jgi:hypothetical protein